MQWMIIYVRSRSVSIAHAWVVTIDNHFDLFLLQHLLNVLISVSHHVGLLVHWKVTFELLDLLFDHCYGCVEGFLPRLDGHRGHLAGIFGGTYDEYFHIEAFLFGGIDTRVQSFLDGMDSLESPAGCTEVGHSLDDRSFEPSLQLVDQAGPDFLIIDFPLLNFFLTSTNRTKITWRIVWERWEDVRFSNCDT